MTPEKNKKRPSTGLGPGALAHRAGPLKPLPTEMLKHRRKRFLPPADADAMAGKQNEHE